MAFCSKCGKSIEDDAQFCAGCGAKQGGLFPDSKPSQNDTGKKSVQSAGGLIMTVLGLIGSVVSIVILVINTISYYSQYTYYLGHYKHNGPIYYDGYGPWVTPSFLMYLRDSAYASEQLIPPAIILLFAFAAVVFGFVLVKNAKKKI